MKNLIALMLLTMALTSITLADGPADNLADKVRPVPPPGIEVPTADQEELKAGLAQLGGKIDALRAQLKGKPAAVLVADVEIYHKAVRYALDGKEFFNPREIGVAKALLKQGSERAAALADGKSPWATATGLVARGYFSKIDGSVQPYGLVVPASYNPAATTRHRLDFWCHGRGETLSELNFIDQRQNSPGEFTPRDAFVLHLYGRYCNANKLAGEIDLLEALDDVKRQYPIDENRLVVRGFSMGGAACWQFAVHYPGLFAAAAPGAGFSETRDFLRVFQNERVTPAWYEQKLWHVYDCTDYAINLFNCPTVAYSGENDRQKQAADIMAEALKAEGLELTHIIGPKTEHSYHPEAKQEVNRRIDSIAARGRNPIPERVRFTTWTLRYPESLWIRLEGLEKHWDRAIVDAQIVDAGTVKLTTTNVSALTLTMPAGLCPLSNLQRPKVIIDSREVEAAAVGTDRSWTAHFRKQPQGWAAVPTLEENTLRKVPGLQGPIDDAFMDSFIMVRPTGKPLNDKVGAWAAAEAKHATEHWRKQFRGDARIKDDTAIGDADIAASNLVLWGDPSSNAVLAKIADKLPIRWTAAGVQVGNESFSSADAVPVLIYANPLNPRRYVVVNSGFTFREYDYLNNARQVPKLPDWAIVNTNVPPSARAPGEIVTAGFFDEKWGLVPAPASKSSK